MFSLAEKVLNTLMSVVKHESSSVGAVIEFLCRPRQNTLPSATSQNHEFVLKLVRHRMRSSRPDTLRKHVLAGISLIFMRFWKKRVASSTCSVRHFVYISSCCAGRTDFAERPTMIRCSRLRSCVINRK